MNAAIHLCIPNLKLYKNLKSECQGLCFNCRYSHEEEAIKPVLFR